MTIASILPGRVPLTLSTTRLTQAITDGQTRLARLQDQLGSGQRFTLPSEAPTAAIRTITLQKLEERRVGFQDDIKTSDGFLAATEQALATIGDALNTARGLLQNGIGTQTTAAEREGLVTQLDSLIQSVLQAANTQYNGRPLFGGSQTDQTPFVQVANGVVRYQGDDFSIQSFADFNQLIDAGANGARDLRGLSTPITADLNPTLTGATQIAQLHGQTGASLGTIRVVLKNGATEVRKDVDLSSAKTIQDVDNLLENAFSGEAITLTVDIDPASNSGLRLTPSAGTVEVRDLDTAKTAADLGIRSAPAAVINGEDLNPALSLYTPLASLNNGTGIGATAGTGLRITNGGQTRVVDLNGAVTVQDLLLRVQAVDPDVEAKISADGSGLSIVTRLNGSDFSIGENGGNNATLLGIRTMTGATRLADLNYGTGINQQTQLPLQITRRDGSTVEISLSTAGTVQQVLDAINAVDPGHLVASLNSVGNGISLTDDSGTGALTVLDNPVGISLGMNGTDNGGTAGVLAGRDVNPQQPQGVFNILATLRKALQASDTQTLNRLQSSIDGEANHIAVVRADVGSRQRLLADLDNHHEDAHVAAKETLSQLFDVNFADAVSQFLQQQQSLEGAMQIASQSMQLSLLKYL